MPTARNKGLIQAGLSLLFVVLVGIGARIQFTEDVLFAISLQSFMLCLGYLLLRQPWRTIAISLYLVLGIAGLPLFHEGGSGWGHFTGESLGFFIGFFLSSFIPARSAGFQQTTTYGLQVHAVLLLFGCSFVAIKEASFDFGWELLQYLLPGAVLKSLFLGLLIWSFQKLVRIR